MTDATTRRWQLLGWVKGDKNPVHAATVVGDHNLNDALSSLERRPEVVRTAVRPL